MASKGTDVAFYIAEESTPNTLPTTPLWHTMRYTGGDVKKTVSLTESETIVDSRYDQGSIATSGEAGGTIDFELTAGGATDLLLEGVSFSGSFVSGTPDTLNVGGKVLKTYTLVRHDKKIGKIEVFSGSRIGQLTISGDTEGKITGQATISSTGYERPLVSPVSNPVVTTTPFVSSLNINAFKINGQSTVGVACVQSFEITINNNLSAQRCLGNASLIPNSYTEGKAQIGLNASVLLTVASDVWSQYVEDRTTVTAEIGIEDTLGNSYGFIFNKLELDNDGPNAVAPDSDNTLDLEFKHVKIASTITRVIAP